MKSWLKKDQEQRAIKRRQALDRWAKVRAHGPIRYVLRMALSSTVWLFIIMSITDLVLEGRIESLKFKLISVPILGLGTALLSWWVREVQFRNANTIPHQKR